MKIKKNTLYSSIGISALICMAVFALLLSGCGEDSSGSTIQSSPAVPQFTADNGGIISYNDTGDGSYNQDCRSEGGGDCSNTIIIVTDSNLSGDHFFGDGHDDASTCPFAEANAAAEVLDEQ